jgi:hypothetical protein
MLYFQKLLEILEVVIPPYRKTMGALYTTQAPAAGSGKSPEVGSMSFQVLVKKL